VSVSFLDSSLSFKLDPSISAEISCASETLVRPNMFSDKQEAVDDKLQRGRRQSLHSRVKTLYNMAHRVFLLFLVRESTGLREGRSKITSLALDFYSLSCDVVENYAGLTLPGKFLHQLSQLEKSAKTYRNFAVYTPDPSWKIIALRYYDPISYHESGLLLNVQTMHTLLGQHSNNAPFVACSMRLLGIIRL
jgi:hypothetical protein